MCFARAGKLRYFEAPNRAFLTMTVFAGVRLCA